MLELWPSVGWIYRIHGIIEITSSCGCWAWKLCYKLEKPAKLTPPPVTVWSYQDNRSVFMNFFSWRHPLNKMTDTCSSYSSLVCLKASHNKIRISVVSLMLLGSGTHADIHTHSITLMHSQLSSDVYVTGVGSPTSCPERRMLQR